MPKSRIMHLRFTRQGEMQKWWLPHRLEVLSFFESIYPELLHSSKVFLGFYLDYRIS